MTRAFFLAALVASSSAFSILRTGTQDLCTIETAPGVTKVVTEADKWKLKAVCIYGLLRNQADILRSKEFDSSTLHPTQNYRNMLYKPTPKLHLLSHIQQQSNRPQQSKRSCPVSTKEK